MSLALEDIWASAMLAALVRPETVLVCGPRSGEGATFVSFYLAMYLAREYYKKVLYVDTETERGQKTMYRSPDGPGLMSYLRKRAELGRLIYRTDFNNLYILPSGFKKGATRRGTFLSPDTLLNDFLKFCVGTFDITILDGQPVSESANVVRLGQDVTQVIFVCKYGYSRRELIRAALDRLTSNNVKVAGTVMNAREYPVPQIIYKILK
ncbi:MAG: hypothetical protein HQK58_04260 [Deltaproteobacteria bacterium]|nr:hypothetical protein [Deltaproteobacteria bacterium]